MKYLMPQARNTVTGQTIKRQDLAGHRYLQNQRPEVLELAEALARDLTARSRQTWRAEVAEYTV